MPAAYDAQNVAHHQPSVRVVGRSASPVAPRRTSSTIWNGRQKLRNGTNQPPMAHPEPCRSTERSMRALWCRV